MYANSRAHLLSRIINQHRSELVCRFTTDILAKRALRIIPFIQLRTASKSGHEESVSYIALYQHLERIGSLFTLDA
jgi:hypothetical protein